MSRGRAMNELSASASSCIDSFSSLGISFRFGTSALVTGENPTLKSPLSIVFLTIGFDGVAAGFDGVWAARCTIPNDRKSALASKMALMYLILLAGRSWWFV